MHPVVQRFFEYLCVSTTLLFLVAITSATGWFYEELGRIRLACNYGVMLNDYARFESSTPAGAMGLATGLRVGPDSDSVSDRVGLHGGLGP